MPYIRASLVFTIWLMNEGAKSHGMPNHGRWQHHLCFEGYYEPFSFWVISRTNTWIFKPPTLALPDAICTDLNLSRNITSNNINPFPSEVTEKRGEIDIFCRYFYQIHRECPQKFALRTNFCMTLRSASPHASVTLDQTLNLSVIIT